MMRRVRLLALLLTTRLVAQTPSVNLHGVVRARAGMPISGANVFVVGTLDGALTDSTGRFEIITPRQVSYRIAVRRAGFRDVALTVLDTSRRELVLTLVPGTQHMAPILVQAGRYAAADEPGAILTPLEIVTIPGTAADVNRAIQTLPGVQQVDEGTGLYVRGGDFTETRVFLNDGLLLTPAQLQSPAGTFVGTLDPFLLDAVYFTAGGFGARYGDALSAIAALNTQARPQQPSATLSVGLAAVGVNLALPGRGGTGFRVVGGRNDLAPVLRLNGSPRQFSVAPHGTDRSASLFWNYRATARLSLFATEQRQKLGALNETPSVVDTFAVENRDRAVVLSWHDVFGRVAPAVVLSSSDIDRVESFGSFDLASPSRLSHATVAVDVALTEAATLRIGAESGRLVSHVDASLPARGDDQRPDARVRLFEVERDATRSAAYVELDSRPSELTRVVLGVRRDRATSARAATLDPRISASMRLGPHATLTSAWGLYHQTVDPLLQLLTETPNVALPSMRARHIIAGIQVGEGAPMIRVEAYDKRYADLAAPTRDFVTVVGGSGRAYGVDLIARAPALVGVGPRIVYSFAHSARTDPNSGARALAPFDVPHNLTIIATKALPRMIIFGASFRYASGRPFTPVISATRSARDSVWTPVYGAPASERLPAFARLDISASWFRMLASGTQLVAYISITNLLDRSNVYARRYSADYSTRYDVRSIFNRSLYFGGVLTFTGK